MRSKAYFYDLDVTTVGTPHVFAAQSSFWAWNDTTASRFFEIGRFLPGQKLVVPVETHFWATELGGFRSPLAMRGSTPRTKTCSRGPRRMGHPSSFLLLLP